MFKDRLRELIHERQVTQSGLAEHLGITRFRLNNYLSGRSEPDFEILTKLCSYFSVSLDYLIGRGNAKKRTKKDTSISPEIVLSKEPPAEKDAGTQWIPVYISVPDANGARENYQSAVGWLRTKSSSLKPLGFRTHYALAVNDTSMAPEFLPGDIVYIQPSFILHSIIPQQSLYAVKLCHSDPIGFMLKRCFMVDNILVCISDNAKYTPVIFNMENTIFEPIAGHVTGVWRYVLPSKTIDELLGKHGDNHDYSV